MRQTTATRELLIVRIGYLSIKYLAHYTQNVDCRNHNRGTGNDRCCASEHIGHTVGEVCAERANKDCHLGNEAREARKSEVCKTCNDISYGEERHNLHQSAQFANVTSMCSTVNHTDKGEEESSHQSVRKHLKDGSRAGGLGHHQQCKEHQTAVGYRRIGIDVLQVGLNTGRESTIYN